MEGNTRNPDGYSLGVLIFALKKRSRGWFIRDLLLCTMTYLQEKRELADPPLSQFFT